MIALLLAATIATTPAPLCRVDAGRICCPVILISRLVADRDAKTELIKLERERCDRLVKINVDSQRAREKALQDDAQARLDALRKQAARDRWVWIGVGVGIGSAATLAIVLAVVLARR